MGNTVEPLHQDLAALRIGLQHFFHAVLRPAKRLQSAELRGGVDAGSDIFLELDHHGENAFRPESHADAPAGHGIGLRETVYNDRAFFHSGEGSDADKGSVGIQQTMIDLIRQDIEILFHTQLCNCFQTFGGSDAARRIGRRIEDEQFCLRSNRLFQILRSNDESFRFISGHALRDGPAHENLTVIICPTGIAQEHFVSRVQQHKQRKIQRLHSARSDHDFIGGIISKPHSVAIISDGLAQGKYADIGRIVRLAGTERAIGGVNNVGRSSKIRFTDGETDGIFNFVRHGEHLANCGTGHLFTDTGKALHNGILLLSFQICPIIASGFFFVNSQGTLSNCLKKCNNFLLSALHNT